MGFGIGRRTQRQDLMKHQAAILEILQQEEE